uniref:Uncharacterized protein n=1 Tax=Nomascus leucogenys TaxID=61853 RepID=A0A2I3HSR8_NOMLE
MKGSWMELADGTPHNTKQLKRLNQVIFSVSYNGKFYKDVMEKNLKLSSGQNADVEKTDN